MNSVAEAVYPRAPLVQAEERQVTHAAHGHMLTCSAVWSPDSEWIVYDIRDDGGAFSGTEIHRVHVWSGKVERLYRARECTRVGIATHHPRDPRVVFIEGSDNSDPAWIYGFSRRSGVIVDYGPSPRVYPLDACNYAPPFAPGALRGGSHVHRFSPDGEWVSFTYEDEVLRRMEADGQSAEPNLRNIGVAVPCGPVTVNQNHPYNRDGAYFSMLVTRTIPEPSPGSDEISWACEENWIGRNGYIRTDGQRQRRALAFQGTVAASDGSRHTEVFVADLPEELGRSRDHGIEGSLTHMPRPPRGVVQRRLTRTDTWMYPGICGPRHWLQSTPDGREIIFLARDERQLVQLFGVAVNSGQVRQIARHPWEVSTAFSVSPNGRWIAHGMDQSVFITDVFTGDAVRLTERFSEKSSPRPGACAFSPNGALIAYTRPLAGSSGRHDQVFVVQI